MFKSKLKKKFKRKNKFKKPPEPKPKPAVRHAKRSIFSRFVDLIIQDLVDKK